MWKSAKYGIQCIIQPGGSVRDTVVSQACFVHDIKMIHTGVRMLYHWVHTLTYLTNK